MVAARAVAAAARARAAAAREAAARATVVAARATVVAERAVAAVGGQGRWFNRARGTIRADRPRRRQLQFHADGQEIRVRNGLAVGTPHGGSGGRMAVETGGDRRQVVTVPDRVCRGHERRGHHPCGRRRLWRGRRRPGHGQRRRTLSVEKRRWRHLQGRSVRAAQGGTRCGQGRGGRRQLCRRRRRRVVAARQRCGRLGGGLVGPGMGHGRCRAGGRRGRTCRHHIHAGDRRHGHGRCSGPWIQAPTFRHGAGQRCREHDARRHHRRAHDEPDRSSQTAHHQVSCAPTPAGRKASQP